MYGPSFGRLWVPLCLIHGLLAVPTTVNPTAFTYNETSTVYVTGENVTSQDSPMTPASVSLETTTNTDEMNTTSIQERPPTQMTIILETTTETESINTSKEQETLTTQAVIVQEITTKQYQSANTTTEHGATNAQIASLTTSATVQETPILNPLYDNNSGSSVQCSVSIDNKRFITVSTMYHLDGLPTGITFITFAISPMLTNQRRDCSIDVDEIAEEIRHVSGVVQIYLILDCTRELNLEIRNGNATFIRQEESLLFLNIRRCILDISDINTIGQLARLDTILVQDTTISSSHDSAYTNVDMSSLRTLLFVNSLRAIPISTLPLHTSVFSSITKLALHHVYFGNHSTSFLDNFPNLLMLSLISCGLQTPPAVSWRNETGYLPLGLSLTGEQMSKKVQEGINIPPNEIPRVLKLVYNKLTNLTAFQFQGHLHSLILNNNQIKNIDEQTFSGLKGVQSVHLSANYINYLPELTFQGLTDLYFLDLGNNIISSIQPGLFAHLPNLVKLNLEANRLTSIPPGTLSLIPNIINLNLGWNQLTSVDPGTMPVSSTHFRVLNLGMNPLQSVSSDLFTTNTLKLIDFTSTGLSLDALLFSLANLTIDQLAKLKVEKPTIRMVSNSIERFPSVVHQKNYTDSDIEEARKIVAILNHFCIDLSGNFLECNCDVGVFLLILAALQSKIGPSLLTGPVTLDWDTCYRGWVCGSPPALKVTPLALVDPNELYCPLNLTTCPVLCDCNLDVNSHLIVDCSRRQINQVNFAWPKNVTEIWLPDNSIVKLPSNFTDGLTTVSTIILSNNSLADLPSHVVKGLEALEVLYVDNNNLTSLPLEIKNTNMENIRLSNNPFLCDCENKWIKEWILEKKSVIDDWQSVKCFTSNGTWQVFTETEDVTFGCDPEKQNDTHNIIVLAIVLSIVAAVVILMAYFHREVQACVFVWFKLSFCATGISPAKLFVVNAEDDSVWVEENVSKVITVYNSKRTPVTTLSDFAAGYTVKENILSQVQKSSVTVLVVSKSFLKADLCLEVVSLMAEVTKRHKCSVAFIVRDNCTTTDLKNTAIERIKRDSSLIFSSNLLFKHLLLHAVLAVPQKTQKVSVNDKEITESISTELETIDLNTFADKAPTEQTETKDFKFDVSVVYHDEERGWVSREIIPSLKQIGYRVGTPDVDFVPGKDHADNIEDLLSNSNQLIYVMSKSFVKDEWSTFIFRMATDLNSRRQINYLCVVMYEVLNDEDIDLLDRDIQVYIKSHTCLNNDKELMNKLNTCLQPPVTLNL